MTDSANDLAVVRSKIRPPVAVVLGSPRALAQLAVEVSLSEAVFYQMDLYQAERVRDELARVMSDARVAAAADLWELTGDFQTVLYPASPEGERQLKLDMIDQAYHILWPRGSLIVWSSYAHDELFPAILKKVFGRYHGEMTSPGQVLWARREGNRPRRRHEMTFQARFDDTTSLRFLTRPGTFSFGRFDHGARALVETMTIAPGDRIVDMGCGCGTNGVWAGRLSGPTGSVAFVDTNLRALALAEHNARANSLASFQIVRSTHVEELQAENFDVALANPPYYAHGSIARNFVERCHGLLRPGGSLYLVTKQVEQVGAMAAETFGAVEIVTRRGYQVLCAEKQC
jgi:16S rRNA (guanine1207-N2)-methyltransferase